MDLDQIFYVGPRTNQILSTSSHGSRIQGGANFGTLMYTIQHRVDQIWCDEPSLDAKATLVYYLFPQLSLHRCQATRSTIFMFLSV